METIPALESMGSIPLAVASAGLLLTAAFGLGGLCLQLTKTSLPVRLDDLLLRTIVGLNALGLLGCVQGQVGWLAPKYFHWLLAICGMFAVPQVLRLGRNDAGYRARTDTFFAMDWLPGPAVFLVLGGVTLGPALCYPIEWDELVYHHVLPGRWLADGWLKCYFDLPYSGFPSMGEILFWLVSPIEHVIAPRFIAWVCWMLGLICLFRSFCRGLSPGAAAMVALVFALMHAVFMISANCYVESIVFMNFAGMWLAIFGPRTRGGMRQSRGLAVTVGLLAGGTATTKLTGVAVALVPCLWYLGMILTDQSRRRQFVGSLLIFLTVMLTVILPFYIRPWLAMGNPFYPYYFEWFTQDPVRLEMSSYHHAIGSSFGVRSLATFINGPIILAFSGATYDGSFGFQLLGIVILAVIALVSSRTRRLVIWPTVASLWLYFFWFFTAQQARFAIPAVAALGLVAIRGLQRQSAQHRRWALAALFVVAIFSLPWKYAAYYRGSWQTVCGRFTWTQYVDFSTELTHLPLIRAVQKLTPPDARLMLIYEHRGFYLPRSYVIGTPIYQEHGFSPPERFARASQVQQMLARENITHVILTKLVAGPDVAQNFAARQAPLLRGIEECGRTGLLKLIWESNSYLMLEVKRPPNVQAE